MPEKKKIRTTSLFSLSSSSVISLVHLEQKWQQFLSLRHLYVEWVFVKLHTGRFTEI